MLTLFVCYQGMNFVLTLGVWPKRDLKDMFPGLNPHGECSGAPAGRRMGRTCVQ